MGRTTPVATHALARFVAQHSLRANKRK